MKRIFYFPLLIFAAGILSCDDYLNTLPGDKYDDATIWQNTNLIDSYVFGIYKGVPYPFNWYVSASMVDEAVPIQNDGVMTRVLTSTMTPEEQGAFAPNWASAMDGWWWSYAWRNIRSCNLFFQKIEFANNTGAAYKEQLKGEVHFLRAYFYYLLLVQYGGVPIIDWVVNIGDDYNIPRNSFEETVNFIVSDLDAAITDNRLASQTDKTRATVGAVLALKSRVLLYAASDLYHSNASWAAGFEHPELIGYTNGNQNELYQKAKEAAEGVMSLGYSLYESYPDPAENFQKLFLEMSSNEQIFIAFYDKVNHYWPTDWIAWVYGTPSYGGWALNQVTGNLANAFENRDGTAFNFAVQKENPYANRDPRFYATILFQGSPWYINSFGILTPTTIDITTGTGADYNKGSTTGYYIKKFISPAENDYYNGTAQPQPYIQIRYAEVLLNYAEACLGLGDEVNARVALNMIRKRAGMPELPAEETGQALIERYRNERRVELAWENHRFFDVRRWMIPQQAYVDATGVAFDGISLIEVVYEHRAWNDSHYLVPINYEEMQKNIALIQNPGY
jgi:starch-binding outer membrane protein, SusD/RagB family